MIRRELIVKRLDDCTEEATHILQDIKDEIATPYAYFEFDMNNKFCTVYNFHDNTFRAIYPSTHFYFEVIETRKQ